MKCSHSFCLMGLLGLVASAESLAGVVDVPPTTPPGIRQKKAYLGKMTPDEHPVLIFTDQANKPLYLFDKDSAGKPSTCSGECAAHWIWVPALAGARAVGE